MKQISSKEDYKKHSEKVHEILVMGATIPNCIFLEKSKYRLSFMEDITIFSNGFFEHLSSIDDLLIGETILLVLNPHPVEYFYTEFQSFPMSVFYETDSAADYYRCISDAPKGSEADSIIFNSKEILIYSSKLDWGIFVDRGCELAVCFFESEDLRAEFNQEFKRIIFPNFLSAANYSFGHQDSKDKQIFIANYKP